MWFSKKKLWEVKNYNNILDFFRKKLNMWFFIKFCIIFFSLWLIYIYASSAIDFSKWVFKNVSKSVVKTISQTVWEEMKEDELGQVNILLLGYWWKNHQWGYLSDTIIIASFNPKLGATTFLSIPRDLYVSDKELGYAWKINWLFAISYMKYKDYDRAVATLTSKLKEITWVDINYYALIDFQWFKKFVDKLGGVDVDVPYDLVDTQYPNENWGYETFRISKGPHHLDGATALKYARSRHSTSDFSRALRQQQIIKWILNDVMKLWNLTDINKMKEIYNEYNNMVETNISFKNILWMAKYLDKVTNFYSFVYSADCDNRSYKTTEPWCFLYYPPREQFNGMSTLLPIGASAWKVSYYKYLQNFSFIVVYEQKFLLENAKIKVLNWLDKKNKKYRKTTPASDTAILLKKNWLNITDIWDAPTVYQKTTLFKNGTWDYEGTIDVLKMLVNIDEILTWDSYQGSWNDLTLVIWNDF